MGDRVPGLSHVGIWPENLSATVAGLRQRGVTVADPRTESTETSITNVTGPNCVQLELLNFQPDPLPRKAMESWK